MVEADKSISQQTPNQSLTIKRSGSNSTPPIPPNNMASSNYPNIHSYIPQLKKPKKQEISIVYLRKDKKENFVFNVVPFNREIVRSINDIYNLRASLVLEFPFYYVFSKDSTCQRKRQQIKLCQHFFQTTFEPEYSVRLRNYQPIYHRSKIQKRKN